MGDQTFPFPFLFVPTISITFDTLIPHNLPAVLEEGHPGVSVRPGSIIERSSQVRAPLLSSSSTCHNLKTRRESRVLARLYIGLWLPGITEFMLTLQIAGEVGFHVDYWQPVGAWVVVQAPQIAWISGDLCNPHRCTGICRESVTYRLFCTLTQGA